jgi:hypothetical protein
MLPTHRPPTHPGEMLLKELLEPLEVSQVEAATLRLYFAWTHVPCDATSCQRPSRRT